MRFVLTALLWLVTTVLLAVAVPAAWAQQNVVDSDGYARFAQNAGADPAVQDAMAAELTTQLVTLAGRGGYQVQTNLLSAAATGYTRSAAFPGQFATANRIAHRWMFTDVVSQPDASGRWIIDLGPMLADSSFKTDAAGLRHPGARHAAGSADRTRARLAAARAACSRWAGGVRGSVSPPPC